MMRQEIQSNFFFFAKICVFVWGNTYRLFLRSWCMHKHLHADGNAHIHICMHPSKMRLPADFGKKGDHQSWWLANITLPQQIVCQNVFFRVSGWSRCSRVLPSLASPANTLSRQAHSSFEAPRNKWNSKHQEASRGKPGKKSRRSRALSRAPRSVKRLACCTGTFKKEHVDDRPNVSDHAIDQAVST